MAERPSHRIITDWQQLDAATGEAIRAFWIREQASVEGDEATRRLAEVVAHVVDANGNLAAVATAEPRILPRLGQPLYYYRCFVGRAWRFDNLVRRLMLHAWVVLESYARARGFPCIGVLVELENHGFGGTMRWAHWPRGGSGLSFIGLSPRGLELRVGYFRGACLKTPEEIASVRAALSREQPARA